VDTRFAVIFAVALLLGAGLPALIGGARAADPAPGFPVRQVCRLFPVNLDKDRDIDTASKTTEVGQWLAEREKEGLVLYTVDFDAAQKVTGYPQGWVQVCTVPAA
jgi:hypothetical protein